MQSLIVHEGKEICIIGENKFRLRKREYSESVGYPYLDIASNDGNNKICKLHQSLNYNSVENILKKLIILLMLMTSFNVYAISTKQFCKETIKQFEQFHTQLPLKIDDMTILTDASAVYSKGNCIIKYNYAIKTKPIVEDIISAFKEFKDSDHVLTFFKSPKGQQVLEDIVQGIAKDSAKVSLVMLKEIKDIYLQYHYTFDEIDLNPIRIEIPHNVSNEIQQSLQ